MIDDRNAFADVLATLFGGVPTKFNFHALLNTTDDVASMVREYIK